MYVSFIVRNMPILIALFRLFSDIRSHFWLVYLSRFDPYYVLSLTLAPVLEIESSESSSGLVIGLAVGGGGILVMLAGAAIVARKRKTAKEYGKTKNGSANLDGVGNNPFYDGIAPGANPFYAESDMGSIKDMREIENADIELKSQ